MTHSVRGSKYKKKQIRTDPQEVVHIVVIEC
jgi:hypothetical protein